VPDQPDAVARVGRDDSDDSPAEISDEGPGISHAGGQIDHERQAVLAPYSAWG